MSFLTRLANGLGTLLGVLVDTTKQVISEIKTSYEEYKRRGGLTGEEVESEGTRTKDRLRVVNDEIMHLRNRRMSRGSLSEQDGRRWQSLRDERDQLLAQVNQGKEVKAAEAILETEEQIEKIAVGVQTTHVLQYNAFADILGKRCSKCGRPMKLQWQRNLIVPEPKDFYWGCTGWYVQQGARKACTNTEQLRPDDYGLMTNTSAPEFSVTAEEFGIILTDPGTEKMIGARLGDLTSTLAARGQGVELATCPVHGENMILKNKKDASGLLDAYFLACPYWKPRNEGCAFIEKLKSGSQLAALLKAETGTGIL